MTGLDYNPKRPHNEPRGESADSFGTSSDGDDPPLRRPRQAGSIAASLLFCSGQAGVLFLLLVMLVAGIVFTIKAKSILARRPAGDVVNTEKLLMRFFKYVEIFERAIGPQNNLTAPRAMKQFSIVWWRECHRKKLLGPNIRIANDSFDPSPRLVLILEVSRQLITNRRPPPIASSGEVASRGFAGVLNLESKTRGFGWCNSVDCYKGPDDINIGAQLGSRNLSRLLIGFFRGEGGTCGYISRFLGFFQTLNSRAPLPIRGFTNAAVKTATNIVERTVATSPIAA